jgi:Polyketide cyclase / dehydrase and lipid transport
LPTLSREIEIDAPREKVWQIVSDIDNEPEYWHGTREVKNVSRMGNVTEREVVQNFLSTTVFQRVTLSPKDSVEVDYLRGTTVGVKKIYIESVGDQKQRLKVMWDVRFTGILWLASPFIKKHVVAGTENALRRIKEAAEGAGETGEEGSPARTAVPSGATDSAHLPLAHSKAEPRKRL